MNVRQLLAIALVAWVAVKVLYPFTARVVKA